MKPTKPSGGIKKWIIRLFEGFLAIVLLAFIFSPNPTLLSQQSTPEPQTITYNQPFRLEFNHPMNQESVEKAFLISPKLEGSFKWANSKTVEFHPEKPLKIGHEYHITLREDAQNLWLKKLTTDFHLDYRVTGPPQLIFHHPQNILPKDGKITLMFDRPMNLRDMKLDELIQIQPPLDGEIAYLGQSAFQFTPSHPETGKTYQIKIPAGILGADGSSSTQAFEWEVKTPQIQILKSIPASGEVLNPAHELELHFDQAIELDQMKMGENVFLLKAEASSETESAIKAELSYKKNEAEENQPKILIIKPSQELEAGHTYKLQVKNTETLEIGVDFELNFKTAPQKENLSFENETEPKPRSRAREIVVSLVGIAPTWELQNALTEAGKLSFCSLESSQYMQLKNTAELENFECPTASITLSATLEEPLQKIDLHQFFPHLTQTGLYFASIQNESHQESKIFVITDGSLLVKHTDNEMLVWAQDLKTGEPIADMDLEFFSPEGQSLGKATTNQEGIYKKEGFIDENLYIVGQKNRGSQTFWTIASNHWKLSESDSLPFQDTAKAQVILNQYHFKKDEPIQVAGYWASTQNQQLIWPGSEMIKVQVLDQWGNLVMEQDAFVKANGSFSATLEPNGKLPQGEYQVIVSDPNYHILIEPISITIVQDGPNLELEWVDAKPYQPIQNEIEFSLSARYENGPNAVGAEGTYKLFEIDASANSDPCTHCSGKQIGEGRIKFDMQGIAKLSLEANEKNLLRDGGIYRLMIQTHQNHQINGQIEHQFEVGSQDLRIKLSLNHQVLKPSQNLAGALSILNHKNQLLENETVTLKIIQIEGGKVIFEEDLLSQNQPEPFSIKIPPEAQGKFLLTANTKEGENQFEKEIVVTDKNENAWETFDLKVDKNIYQVGDSMELVVAAQGASPDFPVYALLSTEREGILTQQILRLSSEVTPVELKIEEKMQPHFDLKLSKISPSETPSYDVLKEQISVTDPKSNLQINLTLDPAEPQPTDQIKVHLETLDANGQPVAASTLLHITDTEIPGAKIGYESFFDPRRNAIPEASTLGKFEGSLTTDPTTPTPRANFDSYYFNPQLETDETGNASFEFEIPPHIDELHFYANSQTGLQQFGFAQKTLALQKDLSLKPALPSFVSLGDETIFSITVKNNSKKEIRTQFRLEGEGLLTFSEFKEVALKPNESKTLDFEVLVDKNFKKTVLEGQFVSELGALEVSLPIQNPHVTLDLLKDGVISQIWSGNLNLALPVIAQSGTFRFILSESPAYLKQHLARKLENEKKSNYLQALQLISKTSLIQKEDETSKRILEFLTKALLQEMNQEGGYSFWETGPSHPTVSATVALAFAKVQTLGLQPNQDQVEETLRYLLKTLESENLSVQDQAFILWVLSEHGQLDTEKSLNAFKQTPKTDLISRAFLLMNFETLYQSGQKSVGPFIELIKLEIADAANVVNEKITFNTPVGERKLTTAIILYALTTQDPENPFLQGLLNELLSQPLDPQLLNPQEALWMTLAIEKAQQSLPKSSADVTFQMKFNQQVLAEQAFDPQKEEEYLEVTEKVPAPQEQGLNNVFVMKQGEAPLYFDVFLTAPLDPLKMERVENGVLITREFLSIESGEPVQELKKGETYLNRLTLIVPHDLEGVWMDSPTIAGAWNLAPNEADQSLFDKIETSPIGLTYFATHLPAGVYQVESRVQAILPGTYHHFPATLKTSLEPGVLGQTEGQTIKVND